MGTIGTIAVAALPAIVALFTGMWIERIRTEHAWNLDNAKQFRDLAREVVRSLSDVDAVCQELVQAGAFGPDPFAHRADQLDLFKKLDAFRTALANASLFLSEEILSLGFSYIGRVTVWNTLGRWEKRAPDEIKTFVDHAKGIERAGGEIHAKVTSEALNFLANRRHRQRRP